MSLRRSLEDEDEYIRYTRIRKNPQTLRRVERVSRHAALRTKETLWDSNEIAIDASVAAVDSFEAAYGALRGLILAGVHSVKGLYGTAKDGVGKIENGVFVPVRDWILLPAFFGVEKATMFTIGFLQSNQAKQLAHHSLSLVRQVPVVGENVLAPTLVFSVGFMQKSWEIIQYPIPSRHQVRDSVNFALNGTKWALTTAGREVFLYIRRADANLTRTLSHTQWRVLGSGPYATLDKLSKREVIDHLCERYFSMSDPLARYELASHIKQNNSPLYHDIVLTGVLKERGGELTRDDEWLSTYPVYRHMEEPFLIPQEQSVYADHEAVPLWFRLPYVNGEKPGREAPWVCFRYSEQRALEDQYRKVIREGQIRGEGSVIEAEVPDDADADETMVISNTTDDPKYPTLARWYKPDVDADVLVDEKRHAVSFYLCCPRCHKQLRPSIPPLVQKECGDLCDECSTESVEMPYVSTLLAPPPVSSIMRPNFWRFYGPGDEVRRATWLLDTPRAGLQPFDEEAQTILEDAYLFLKWMSVRQEFVSDSNIEGALLTVEVTCPDGKERLIQFASLSQATAIQKGVFSAVSLFKRRVYRGSWLQKPPDTSDEDQDGTSFVQKSIAKAVTDSGTLGDTVMPDTNLRSVLTPMEEKLVLYMGGNDLAVPTTRLMEEDMVRYLEDLKDTRVDHLCLIVHGIGEMMRSANVFGLSLPNLSSIVDCCGFLRRNHTEVQDAHFSEMYPTADATVKAATGRVEYLPIEWHEAFTIASQRRKRPSREGEDGNVMVQDISLRTIPNMREFANDTLMDVLYFMSPQHHDTIADIVANEMNSVVEKFCELTGFTGRVSLIGHSLGSIISWDILAHQRADVLVDHTADTIPLVPSIGSFDTFSDYATARGSESDDPEVTQSSQTLSLQRGYPQLSFSVDNLFLLGSPAAMFLMIRNQQRPLRDDYFLPGCPRVFNIFHPFDPVAYRLEPCIDPRNAEFEPSLMKHWNGGFRVQYQTKILWRKLVDTTFETQQNMIEAFEKSMANMGLIEATIQATAEEEDGSDLSIEDKKSARVNTGMLNRQRRIDYMLQEKEIETANEYVSALAAHSSYWTEKDLSLFIARQIYLSTMEQAAVDAEVAERAQWEALP